MEHQKLWIRWRRITNPEKIQAKLMMGKPTKLHEVQQLAGRVAALSRFVARLGEKALPFYALMKNLDKKFEWTEEADVAFLQLKKCFPHHQCWSHRRKESHYYYTSALHTKW
jgi:hypothetical protein